MSMVTIPAGQSVRAVAERLGVSVDELKQHAGVEDAEAPLPAAKRVEVPDGFLRTRPSALEKKREALPTTSGRQGGMNFWLAMDIEQKRTRAAGGMKAKGAKEPELDALAEAWRTLNRLEADGNELCVELFDKITVSQNIDVRAESFSGEALALGYRFHLFGDSLGRSRAQALSAAKGALLAQPKLPEARVAMAMALRIEPSGEDLKDALGELERAHDLASPGTSGAARVCSELAALRRLQGRLEDAAEWVTRALEHDPDFVLALELGGSMAREAGELNASLETLTHAVSVHETYANTWGELGLTYRARGDTVGEERALKECRQRGNLPAHIGALVARYGVAPDI